MHEFFQPLRRLAILFVVAFAAALCRAQTPSVDRQPAVAGTFYPADKNALDSSLADYFSKAVPSKNNPDIVAVIAPHAGYVFSGIVAASSFNQIDPQKNYEDIFVIGSSHYVAFDGASIYRKGNFITPLGTVKVDTKLADELIKEHPVFNDRDDAHAKEHCVEAEIPFLQYRMKAPFQIVPIVIGTDSPDICREIAEALRPYFTKKNLFVISTDFSHYPAYNDAVSVDKITADAVCANSADYLISILNANTGKRIPNLLTSMCGWSSVLTLLYLTRHDPAYTFDKILYRNSGDSPVGDSARVVGYNAIAVSKKDSGSSTNQSEAPLGLTDGEKHALLSLARRAIELWLNKQEVVPVNEDTLSKNLLLNCGAFVTLNKNGNLRGCVGSFEPRESLYKVVRSMAIEAATLDPRFTAVEPEEVSQLQIEISVLTPMRRIFSIADFTPGKDGIYMTKDGRSGTLLPQVATESGWSKEELLGHCAEDKAGIGWDGWRDAELYTYRALVFGESK